MAAHLASRSGSSAPPPTRLDRLIGWLSPKRGAQRAAYRAAMAFYDGATLGRRGASIRRSAADINVITSRTLPRLRNGSRDQIRNNAHAKRAKEAIVANTVGIGIAPQFMRGSERAEDIEALADLHLETTDCDTDRRHTYHGLQSVAFGSMVESGGAIVRRRRRRTEDGLTVPVQFQLLEPDYIDISRHGPTQNGGMVIQGVEFDRIGRRRGFWLYRNHPGGEMPTVQSRFVPAEDVAYAFRTDRPGQVHGIPWIAPVLLRMADYADYVDAQVVRQKIAACFAVFIEEPFDNPHQAVGKAREVIDQVEPGIVERLPPGAQVKFAEPPGVQNYGEFAGVTLREIAAGWGISYEAMTGDLRNVNFSSGKMGRLEFDRNSDIWRMLTFIPQLCMPLTRWFLEAAMLVGASTEGVTVRHVPPRRAMIDPPREFRAERDAMRSGQKTFTQVIRESGRDPVEHLLEYAADLAILDRLKIILDSDARLRTNAGLAITDSTATDDGGERDEMQGLLEDLEDRLALTNGSLG